MSKESDFLLGIAFGLLTQIRQHLIRKEDVYGVELMEDEYQEIKREISNNFYGENK